MAVSVKVDGLMVVAGLAVVAGVAIYLQRRKLLNKVNPVSDENLAYQGANAVTEKLTGGRDKTLGDFWYRKCAEQNFEPWYCPEPVR